MNRYGVTFMVERFGGTFVEEEVVVDATNAADAMTIATVRLVARGSAAAHSTPRLVDMRAIDVSAHSAEGRADA